MSTRFLLTLCSLSALALAGNAQAESAEPAGKIAIGAATEAILATQREGQAAGSQPPYTGQEATRAYKRYLDSFSKPMPDFKEIIGTTGKSGG